jgi:CBS domain-containing protein
MPNDERRQKLRTKNADIERLSDIVEDLAEVVARLTHAEEVLAVHEGKLEAEQVALEARNTHEITALSPVGLLADRKPAQVSSTATLRDIGEALIRHNVGALVVHGRLASAGIITERDLARAIASGANPDTELAMQWMHQPVIWVDQTDTVVAAGKEMIGRHVRHLVIADGDRVTGVISARDVLACLIDEVKRA